MGGEPAGGPASKLAGTIPPSGGLASTIAAQARAGTMAPIRRETIHRMTRRRNGWDYCARGAYMITLTLADRSRGWLGDLRASSQGDSRASSRALGPAVELSPLGRLLADKWREIAANWPGVEVADFVVMPDHLHGILKITRRQAHPLGQIVGSFKARSTSAGRELAIVPASLLAGSSLWSEGLVDSILWSDERFSRARAYIADNPRRLLAKRLNPELFTIRRDLAVKLPLGEGGAEVAAHFSAVGNDGLLSRIDFHQVQCSRRFFAYRKDKWGKPLKTEPPAVETDDFRAILDEALAAAKAGEVLVNPCISQGEREIARRAFAVGAAMVVLRNKGFSPLFKPEGALFDRCAEGRILMLAPAAWPYQTLEKPMTREDACALNRISQAIARDGAVEIDYKGLKPISIDRSAREACLAAA